LQLQDCLITRDNVDDPSDPNLTPNISAGNITCNWKNNVGLPNTIQGGKLTCTSEDPTIIGGIDQQEILLGTMTASDMEHFVSPTNATTIHFGIIIYDNWNPK
jgi:hypothetical protein